MKVLVAFLLSSFSLTCYTQELKNNYYSNTEAGFSIKFGNEWKVKTNYNINSPIFANNDKKEIISVGLNKVPLNSNPQYSKKEAEALKPQIIAGLKQRGVTIEKITVAPGEFLGRKCLVTIAHLKDPNLLSGELQYHKTIQFIHRNYMFNLIYSIPLSIFTMAESSRIERQLNKFSFF